MMTLSEMDNQQAKPVKYRGQISQKYLIYPNCKVYSLYSNKFLKESYTHQGYLKYILVEFKNKPTVLGHRILAETFLSNFKYDLQVNHIDGDKSNNHISNLEMVTPKENSIHAHKLGLSKGNFGESNGRSKLNVDNVHDICRLLIFTSLSSSEIGKRHKVCASNVGAIKTKKSWTCISDLYWTGELQRLSRK